MSGATSAIETRGLRKEYGGKAAVADLTLSVAPGEIFGFLGPNGAGKTTSVKMLLGLTRPTSGRATVLGLPIGNPSSRQRVGFLPEHFRFHEWLRADEFLDVHARFYGISRDVRRSRISRLLELVGLTEAADQRLSTFSKGMLQRIGLAQALINDPEVVFLDEPTSGLDPLGRRMVRDVIAELKGKSVTVFLNSHLLSEVEVTCTRAAFIAQGRVRAIRELGQDAQALLRVELRVGAIDDGLLRGLGQWSQRVQVNDGRITLAVASREALPQIARWIVGRGTDLYSLSPRPVSLEELFVRIVEGGDECAGS